MRTIGSELAKNRGLGPGFDFLRVFLAFCVVATHTCVVVGFKYDQVQFAWFASYWVLAIFFSLSGFLIAGSALRLTLKDFLINRSLRILPALAVEIVLAALLLGPIFTTLSLYDYFTNPQVLHYMTNIVGWVNYDLPGVFRDHPSTRVNTSLWTVPFEIGCYAIISVLIYLGMLKKPLWVLCGAIWITVVGLFYNGALGFGYDLHDISWTGGEIINVIFADRGSRLFVSFLLGIAAYLYRDKIPYDARLFWLAVLYCVGISALDPLVIGIDTAFPLLNLIAAVPLTYIMAYLGVSPIPRLPLFHRGDYSYGIYLYGFPLQQVMFAVLPTKNLLLHFIAAVLVITPFAIFSWHFIEKPILHLRKKFSFVARQRLEEPAVTEEAKLVEKAV